MIKSASTRHFEGGSTVFKEGEPSDGMYVVLSGSLRIEHNGVLVSTIFEGGIVGEIGVLNDWPRSADLIVAEKADVLFLPKFSFDKMIQDDQTTALKIYKNATLQMGKMLRGKNVVLEFSHLFDEHDSEIGIPEEDLEMLKSLNKP
jgi:CRP-like cAMP-binding protein